MYSILGKAAVLISAFGILAACGGGSGGSGSFDPDQARDLTGSTAPRETVAAQEQRAEGIGTRIDSLAASRLHGETTHDSVPMFTVVPVCSDSECTFTEPTTGASVTIDTDDLLDSEEDFAHVRAVLTKNDITLLEGRGGDYGRGYRVYGAWMDHGGFAVETGAQISEGGVTLTGRGTQAVGDLTGSRPSADATYRGLMVGTPARGERRDHILQGDAELTFDAAENQIDARFSNIVDLDRNAPHSVREISFDDVPVDTDGTYAQGDWNDGNRIEGGFLGTGHAETAGVFEKDGVIGAFGAKPPATN